jgi:tRNA threonylcarbamoyladenosine biosynthesis protein TsaB
MAVILALDTSTEACSCALDLHGCITERYVLEPRQHARLLLPMIKELLTVAALDFNALDAIACGRGPGSFTGLRIAAGVTQGIAFAAELPVVPVSTLAAVALEVHQRNGAELVLACLDARIEEVYWGLFTFTSGLPKLLGDEHLSRPEDMLLHMDRLSLPIVAGGNGLDYLERFPPELRASLQNCQPELLPRASRIVTIAALDFARGLTIAPEALRPVYLRDQVTRQASTS